MLQYRESLKDLPGVKVVVERFRRQAEDAGFDRQTFQTDVELKLRMAGIKVIEDGDWPWLYVNVGTLQTERNRNDAYSVILALSQRVFLESQISSDLGKSSEESLTMFGATWIIGTVGFGTVDNVRTTVKNSVDIFINDWLAVNPIKGTD